MTLAFFAALGAALALAAIWFGYPVVMAALAALRTRTVPDGRRAVRSVTVILATRETGEPLVQRVQDLLAQEWAPLQVVVGIDASTDGDGTRVSGVDRLRWVKATGAPGKAGALNAAVAQATGDVLVFADVAQRFRPGAVAALVDALQHPAYGAVSGELWIGEDDRPRSPSEWYWKYERWVRDTEARVHSAVGVTGAIYAMPRSLWRPLPDGCILDDVHTPMRLALAGYRIGFTRAAVAVDGRRFAGAREYARKVRTQTGIFQLLALLPALRSPSANPLFFPFLFHKLLRLLTPLLAAVLVAAAGVLVGMSAYRAFGVAGPCVAGGLALAPLLHRGIRGAAGEGVLMQWALVRATINGMRGRWDVWN